MTFSNSFQILAGLVLATSLIACGGRQESNPADVNTFKVETISIDKVSVQTRDESNQPRKKLYNFSACIQDKVLEAPIKRTLFSVGDGKSEILVKSDDNGCLLWTETHEVDSLQNEEIFEVTRLIRGRETYNGTVAVPFAFNPWNDGEALLDLRKQKPVREPQKISSLEFGSKASAFQSASTSSAANSWRPWAYSNAIGLEFLDLDYANYKVSNLLSLQVAQKFRVFFSPKILRRTLDGNYSFTSLASGQFRLRMTFLKSTADLTNPSQKDIIAQTDSTLETRNDEVASGYLTLSFSDMALAASKMKVLVEISPLTSSGRFSPGYFTGQISPLKANSASIDLEPRLDLESVAVKMASVQPEVRSSNLEFFAKYSGYSRLSNESNFEQVKNVLNQQDPRAFEYQAVHYMRGELSARDQAAFERALCYKLYYKANDYSLTNATALCLRAPKSYMEIMSKDLAQEVISTPKPVGVTREYSLSISNSFSFSQSTSVSSGSKFSSGAGISADLPIFSLGIFGAKMSAGYDVYYGVAKDKTTSSSTSGSVTMSQSISAIANSFEFDVKSQKCLLVKPSAQLAGSMLKTNADQIGYYLCDAKVVTSKAQETFYFVNQSVGSSPFTDADSALSTKWRMTIRGDKNFEIFKKIVENPNVVLEFEKYTEKINGSELPKEFMMNQSFPGIL